MLPPAPFVAEPVRSTIEPLIPLEVVPVAKCVNQGLDDRFGRMRIGLADPEVYDLDATGFELVGHPAKSDNGGLAERI